MSFYLLVQSVYMQVCSLYTQVHSIYIGQNAPVCMEMNPMSTVPMDINLSCTQPFIFYLQWGIFTHVHKFLPVGNFSHAN